MPRPCWLSCFVLGLVLPALVVAQPAVVEEHLRRGVELRRGGHDEASLVEFESAYRLAPGPRTAAQLGLARQAVGRWLDADHLLREALAAPDDPWIARHRGALDGALAVVGQHLGALEVRCNVDGAALRVEGALVGVLPLREPVRVLAGTLTVEVSATGYEGVIRRFVVDPGVLVREVVELRALAPPPAVIPAPAPPQVFRPTVSDPGRSRRRAWGLASLLGAGSALALGGVALALREDAAVRYNATCPAPETPTRGARCESLEATEATWTTAAWVALPVGVALATTGAMLLVLSRATERRTALLGCAPDATRPGLACVLSF